jgi:tetratricopeptide (TPR) repeat protein
VRAISKVYGLPVGRYITIVGGGAAGNKDSAMDREDFSQAWRWAVGAALLVTSLKCVALQAPAHQSPNPPSVEQVAQETTPQPEAALQTGISLTRSGHFSEAIPHFLAARGRVSDEFAAEFNLALCYVGVGEFQKAIFILAVLRNGTHENASVENLLSQAYEGNHQPKEAFEAFQKAADFTPKDEKLYLLVAAAFSKKQDYFHNLRVLQSGLRNLPDSARLHYELGFILWQLGESGLAQPEFERAASLSPHSVIGYLAAAQKGLMLGNVSQAAQIARTAINEGFTDYQLLTLLGEALIQSGASPGKANFAEAKEALEKSIAARPNYASSQIALGRLLLQEERVDPAIEHLELGRQLAPQDPSCYLLLATAYRKHGQPEQARAMMAMVAKLNEEQAEQRRLAFDKSQ